MPRVITQDKTELEPMVVIKTVTYKLTVNVASRDEAEVTARATDEVLWEREEENLEVIPLPF